MVAFRVRHGINICDECDKWYTVKFSYKLIFVSTLKLYMYEHYNCAINK